MYLFTIFVFYLFGNNSMTYSFEYCVCVICRIKMRFLLASISQNGQH